MEKKRNNMVESLERRGYLDDPGVKEAFEDIPREKFVPERVKENAYVDCPLSIGQNQTISAPSMIAIMLEALEVKEGNTILEIGTGSGYNAALLSELAGDTGKVYSIERFEDLAEKARRNLERAGHDDVEVKVGDGTRGYEEKAPWDRIIVTACAPTIPQPLIDQLKNNGILVAPVGEHYRSQILTLLRKSEDGKIEKEERGTCAFVPLVGEHAWDEEKAP